MVPLWVSLPLGDLLKMVCLAAISAFFNRLASVVVLPFTPALTLITLPSLSTRISTTTMALSCESSLIAGYF